MFVEGMTFMVTNSKSWHYEKNGCFATHYIYMLWMLPDKLHELQSCGVAIHHIRGAIHYNSIVTLAKQLIFTYYATPL
jgi:hypothetical protein